MTQNNKIRINLYCTPQDKETFKLKAKERDMATSSYLLFVIKSKRLPPTRTDVEIAAKLLECQQLLDEIKTKFPEHGDQIETI